MAVRVLNQQEVERLLDMEGCIEAMGDALTSLARGEVHVPLRFLVTPPGEPSLIGLMPAHRAGESPLSAAPSTSTSAAARAFFAPRACRFDPGAERAAAV